MKICAISDLHGNLPEIPEVDLLIIAGDITPVCNHEVLFQRHWLNTNFRHWLESLKCKKIVSCAGNHDFIFEESPHLVPDLPWTYLQDQLIEWRGLRIYGTPWQPRFQDWAFNLDEEELALKWERIPNNLDILVCHGPPKFIGDIVNNCHTGYISLLKRIEKIKPKIVVFGHIHPGYGKYRLGNIVLYNVSILDDNYKFVNKPTVFTI